ncbi:hypothetical protein CPB86DRAFT_709325 [Serendipita vermifera]|nr:hypothetical protein CPB86DRAFT_709325 [Serendipita vermifera]
MSIVAIRSRATGKYLSLDGRGIDRPNEGAGSTAANGSIGFESTSFTNVFLRFDGSRIPPGRRLDNGGGIVNAQFGLGTYEQFVLKVKPDTGIVAIESKEFPGRYLRAAGNTVNGQGTSEANEEFEIIFLSV